MDPSASTSWVTEIKVYITIPGLYHFLLLLQFLRYSHVAQAGLELTEIYPQIFYVAEGNLELLILLPPCLNKFSIIEPWGFLSFS